MLVSVVSVFAVVVVVVVVDVAVSVFAVVAVVLVGVAEVISPLTPSLVAAFALLLLQDPRLEKWSTLSRNVVLASGVGLPGLVFQERRPQWAVSVLHEAPRGVLHGELRGEARRQCCHDRECGWGYVCVSSRGRRPSQHEG